MEKFVHILSGAGLGGIAVAYALAGPLGLLMYAPTLMATHPTPQSTPKSTNGQQPLFDIHINIH